MTIYLKVKFDTLLALIERHSMRGVIFIVVMLLLFGYTGCSNKSRYATKVVKPKYHHSWFNRKKDKKVKRTKMVRMQS